LTNNIENYSLLPKTSNLTPPELMRNPVLKFNNNPSGLQRPGKRATPPLSSGGLIFRGNQVKKAPPDENSPGGEVNLIL
jgi:hypothetical protein